MVIPSVVEDVLKNELDPDQYDVLVELCKRAYRLDRYRANMTLSEIEGFVRRNVGTDKTPHMYAHNIIDDLMSLKLAVRDNPGKYPPRYAANMSHIEAQEKLRLSRKTRKGVI